MVQRWKSRSARPWRRTCRTSGPSSSPYFAMSSRTAKPFSTSRSQARSPRIPAISATGLQAITRFISTAKSSASDRGRRHHRTAPGRGLPLNRHEQHGRGSLHRRRPRSADVDERCGHQRCWAGPKRSCSARRCVLTSPPRRRTRSSSKKATEALGGAGRRPPCSSGGSRVPVRKNGSSAGRAISASPLSWDLRRGRLSLCSETSPKRNRNDSASRRLPPHGGWGGSVRRWTRTDSSCTPSRLSPSGEVETQRGTPPPHGGSEW